MLYRLCSCIAAIGLQDGVHAHIATHMAGAENIWQRYAGEWERNVARRASCCGSKRHGVGPSLA